MNFFTQFFVLLTTLSFYTGAAAFEGNDTSKHSTQNEALQFLSKQTSLQPSIYWTNVKPTTFLENLTLNIQRPLSIYEGRATNFCSYAALSYIALHDDPLGFVRFMLQLYKDGEATMSSVHFQPSLAVQKAAGTFRYKGKLDARPAEQMWFLVLADHFKGYLNFFDHHYNTGDEDKFWAATNYAKFNRMVRKLFNYNVHAVGSDLLRPGIKSIVHYLENKMDSGVVFLYVNNTYLTKKTHGTNKGLPSHYITLLNISEINDVITITYWDYGGKTLQQVSPSFLKKITFGISYCTPKKKNAE